MEDIETKYPFEASGMRLSHLQVCEYGGQFFIGRMQYNEDYGYEEEGIRESEYFHTRKAAEEALETGDWVPVFNEDNEYLYLQNEDLRPKVSSY